MKVHKTGIRSALLKSFFCLLITGFAQGAYAQNDFCTTKNTSFTEGEKLTFKVFYNLNFVWINAGNAYFTTTSEDLNGHKVYHITGDGKTARSYEWFYKVNDRYETFVDKETMLPQRFLRDVSEGGIKIKQDVAFDHKKGKVTSAKKVYDIPKCTQDVLSTIYFARNIDYSKFKPGDKIPFSMFLDDKVYNLYIKYVGKEEIKTKIGTFKSIKIVPLLIEGTIFDGGEKMTVWVSDDPNHVPLRINSPILVGSIKVDLVEYSGLRNAFSSVIKWDK